jgi:PAS domain S-box-containing protein
MSGLSKLTQASKAWLASLSATATGGAAPPGQEAEWFLAATEGLRDGFARFDADGHLLFFNPEFLQHLPQDARARVRVGTNIAEVIDLAWLGKEAMDMDMQTESGRWINYRRNPIAGGGQVLHLRDITKQKVAELEIRESEARYRAVVNTQTEFVARFRPNGLITFANDAYCRYMGKTFEEMTSWAMGNFEAVHKEDRKRHDEHVASLTVENPIKSIIIRTILPDRTEHWEEWTDTGVFDSDGSLLELQAVGRNITNERLAEVNNRESEARYRAVVNTQTEFVVRFRPDGHVTFANDAYARYMQNDIEQLNTLPEGAFTFIYNEDRPAHDAHVARLSPTDPTRKLVSRALLPDGQLHWEEWTDTGIFDENGLLMEIQAVGREISAQKQVEAELNKQREALHQSEKLAALGSLLAGVAHELNNPLSIVVGYSGMLYEMAGDEATKRRANEVHVAAERCARIIKTFLAMARSRPAARSRVDIEAVLDSVLELGAYGLRTSGVDVVRVRGDLPTTFADADQLHQVFMNLVLNAQQAMSGIEGQRTLTVTTSAREGKLHIVVADNGSGMSEAVRLRAFEPFFTTKPQGVGTGIGLSVCLGIVEAHGGRILLESEPGAGARFAVELPIATAAAEDEPGDTAGPQRLQGHVLVVDDEPAIAELVAAKLEQKGLLVTTATSGQAALEGVRNQHFDAVLTDLRMPDMPGDRLIDAIVALRPGLEGRVIVMTGDALGSAPGLEDRQFLVLEKPLDFEALAAALKPLLEIDSA